MEAMHARAPEPLQNKKPMDKTWNMWKREFNIFLKVTGYDKKSSDEKATLLQHHIGKVGLEAMADMKFESNEDQDFDMLMKMFDNHFDPPKRESEERYKFYTRHRGNNEPIENYIQNLKERAKTCNFGDLTESLIRDMVILDIKDKHLRQIMFDAQDLDINKLIMLYKQYELNTEKMKEVSQKASKTAGTIPKDSNPTQNTRVCWKCGTTHAINHCPAFKSVCESCKEKGHFTVRCKKDLKNCNKDQDNNKSKNYTKHPFNQSGKKD